VREEIPIPRRERTIAYLCLTAAAFVYASNAVVGRVVMPLVPPFLLSALRGLLGLTVLLPLTYYSGGLKVNRRDLPRLALLGLLGISIAYITLALGLRGTTATNASIIMAIGPAVTNILLAVGWKILPSKAQVGGVVLAFAGLLVVFTGGTAAGFLGFSLNPADALIIANVVSVSTFSILAQDIMERYRPLLVTFYATLFGTLFLIPGAAVELVLQGVSLQWWGWLMLVYLGIVVSGLGVFFNFMGIHRIGSGPAAIFLNLNPVFAMIMAAIFLNEAVTWAHIGGMLLVFGGVFIVLWANRNQPTTSLGGKDQSA